MKILIATDAWFPQTNGVVTTLDKITQILRKNGHDVVVINPGELKTLPMPTYPEIRLALFPGRYIRKQLDKFAPDAIHIATEGPIGFSVRSYCLRKGLSFTTSYHTQYPEYIRLRLPIPLSFSYWFMKWFHGPAIKTMVPTESIRKRLSERGFKHVVIWSRGVDTDLFKPNQVVHKNNEHPVFIYVGRVAVEKNLDAFLSLDVPGQKVVVGDGPDRQRMQSNYPEVHFTGYQYGEELAATIADANVFVFPSKTDTFGLVMLEAMACGLPVAAYPVSGPIDVVINGETGVLHNDLAVAVSEALKLNGMFPREYALRHSWEHSAQHFIDNLAPRQFLQHDRFTEERKI